MSDLIVSDLVFTPSRIEERDTGLMGWIECQLGESLRLDGIALRRTREGRITLGFPARKSSSGAKHYYFRPASDRARREIEMAILGELRASTEGIG